MDLIDFIVHELDMDFSNRRLSDVFQRRLGEAAGEGAAGFLDKEFESASSYFQHVEGKLNNLLVFFATLLIAVITACYYIGSSDMFKNLGFSRTPRSFLIALLLFAFTLISVVFVGVYTELRVRKIRMLEEMAAIRGYEIQAADRKGANIRERYHHGFKRFGVSSVSASTERGLVYAAPHGDLKCVCLCGGPAISDVRDIDCIWGGLNTVPPLVWIAEGLIAWVAAAYLEFAWFTRFCYQLDLERKRKFSQAQYLFFSKHGESFPWPLHRLDSLANWIERRYSAQTQRAEGAQARQA